MTAGLPVRRMFATPPARPWVEVDRQNAPELWAPPAWMAGDPSLFPGVTRMSCYYFGVWPGDDAGHFLYDAAGARVREADVPFPVALAALDGGLLPRAAPPYRVYEVAASGWRFFSFWDHSGDDRPGSVSVLVDYGDGGAGWYLANFRKVFPKVFARLDRAGVTLTLHDPEAEAG